MQLNCKSAPAKFSEAKSPSEIRLVAFRLKARKQGGLRDESLFEQSKLLSYVAEGFVAFTGTQGCLDFFGSFFHQGKNEQRGEFLNDDLRALQNT